MTDGEIAELKRLMGAITTPLPFDEDFEGIVSGEDHAYRIAAANAVPGLLGEIERLNGEVEDLESRIRRA